MSARHDEPVDYQPDASESLRRLRVTSPAPSHFAAYTADDEPVDYQPDWLAGCTDGRHASGYDEPSCVEPCWTISLMSLDPTLRKTAYASVLSQKVHRGLLNL